MKRLLSSVVLIVSTAAAMGQIAAPIGGIKISQPWNRKLPSVESRVVSCANPFPQTTWKVALDDWICPDGRPIIRVNWWGLLSTPPQGKRTYYIAIFNDNGNCQPVGFPQSPIYKACVRPDVVRYVGTDCTNKRVYFLSASLLTSTAQGPFPQQQGKHYWLQISEVDSDSVRVGLEDFRWSRHLPVQNCPALQFPPLAILPPDECYQTTTDLSFQLMSRALIGTIRTPFRKPIFSLSLGLAGTTTDASEVLSLEADEDGNFVADPESADGSYPVLLEATGMLSKRGSIQLLQGTEFRMSFFDVFFGDLTGDNTVDDFDIAQVIFNFGKRGE